MNEYQKSAAYDRNPVVAVAAAPGSGKSTTLVAAVEHEADRSGKSDDIALITFTNAAADVMRQRLKIPVGFVGTLHSYILRMLRRQSPDLEVIDLKEADRILLEIASELRYQGSYAGLVEARNNFWNKPPILGRHSPAERVVLAYAGRLQQQNLAEFDMILARGHRFLKTGDAPPMKFFVDEFQDTADIDMAIYNLHPKNRLFIVGDPDQSIYEFRNANPELFSAIWRSATATRHQLFINYRSTAQICACASNLIQYNPDRINLKMEADGGPGEEPLSYIVPDVMTHDMQVANLVAAHKGSSIAVLCRTNDQVKELDAFLMTRGVTGYEAGTCHWSKGQEFDVVIIAHADESLEFIPTPEDRRLFYVAMTRAKKTLYTVSVIRRHIQWKGWQTRRPTPFINEAQIKNATGNSTSD